MNRGKRPHASTSSSNIISLSDESDASDDDFFEVTSRIHAASSDEQRTATSHSSITANMEDGLAILKKMRETVREPEKPKVSKVTNNKRGKAMKFQLSDEEDNNDNQGTSNTQQGKTAQKAATDKNYQTVQAAKDANKFVIKRKSSAADIQKIKARLSAIGVSWSTGDDEVTVEETVNWLGKCLEDLPDAEELELWMTEREFATKKMTLEDEDKFCDGEILQKLLQCKSALDAESSADIEAARSKANPFELTGKQIFMNRAAVKMANIDAVFDFMFTNPKSAGGRALIPDSSDDLLYFADICAGPGGFSEYVLWRRKWQARGFGFTLEGDNDFKLHNMLAGPAEAFEPFYGPEDKNSIHSGKNLELFAEHVRKNTIQDGKTGVHFVMADGAFSVLGQENIQELLYKRLYLCQMLCALMVLREGGHFVCRLCDIFTPFSVGLVYLAYRCFEGICIHKPNSSRPPSSERYLVCRSLRPGVEVVQQYLFDMNTQFDALKPGQDIMDCVPLDVINRDDEFLQYIQNSNEQIATIQSLHLAKTVMFITGNYDEQRRQESIRDECLQYWQLNDRSANDFRRQPNRDVQSAFRKLRGTIPFATAQLSVIPFSSQQLPNLLSCRAVFSGGDLFLVLGLGRTEVRLSPVKAGRLEGLSGLWEQVSSRAELKHMTLQLPAETLLLGEFVEEISVHGTTHKRTKALHIVDAYWLGKEMVANKPYDVRMRRATKFAKSVVQMAKNDAVACPLRVKNVRKATEMHDDVGRLQIFRPRNMRYGMMVTDYVNEQTCYGVQGMHFIPITKNPWKMIWSNTQQSCYVFNPSTGKTATSLSEGIYADASVAIMNWKTWKWTTETGAVDDVIQMRAKETLLKWLEAAKVKK